MLLGVVVQGLKPVKLLALCKPAQHCWMLHVVVQGLKPVKLLAPCQRAQHCWPTSPKCKKIWQFFVNF